MLENVFIANVHPMVTALLKQFFLTKPEQQRLTTYLRYEHFYTGLVLDSLDRFSLLQRIAEVISIRSLKQLLIETPSNDIGQLVLHCFRHYREGSYAIITTLEQLHPQLVPLHQLISGLRHYYFDPTQRVDGNLNELLAHLKTDALSKTALSHQLYTKLLKLIVESPLMLASFLQTDPSRAGESHAILYKQFGHFPSLEEFQLFTENFGIHNEIPFIWENEPQPETTLCGKLELLCNLFSLPAALANINTKEIAAFFSFVLNISHHIRLIKNPLNYCIGLSRLGIAIPTQNKRLSGLPSIFSLLVGLKTITKDLSTTPIFIYDQSKPAIFHVNGLYLRRMERQWECRLLHFSSEDIVLLAGKIGIDRLINTSLTGDFGYGGARNCAFLLTPVLKQLFLNGESSVEQIKRVPSKSLKNLFQHHVLGKKSQPGDTVFMCDDDMEIPPSNLLSHCFLASETSGRYFFSSGYSIGRATKFNLAYVALDQALAHPSSIFASTQWSSNICSAGMAEYLSKPKLCLNLPFGSEELHQRVVLEENPLLHPSPHLGGARYPKGLTPTQPWVGIEKYLKGYISYTIHIAMVASLLDPPNKYGCCVFPWNSTPHMHFSNLRQVIHFMTSRKSIAEVQGRFWNNLDQYRNKRSDFPLTKALHNLLELDPDQIIQEYKKNQALPKFDKQSLNRIKNVYVIFQEDACLFHFYAYNVDIKLQNIEFIKQKIETDNNIQLSSYPLTYGLYLLLRAVGLGEFQEIIAQMELSK